VALNAVKRNHTAFHHPNLTQHKSRERCAPILVLSHKKKMHILHRLPFPLIISSLLSLCFTSSQCSLLAQSANVIARAAPIDSADDAELFQLTPDTFKQSVADGNWFVEHFSPSCPHCRLFALTWEQLVLDAKVEFPSVNLAQVNCTLYGGMFSPTFNARNESLVV
jgi:thiol-disulfide isomerase/thioredoxin